MTELLPTLTDRPTAEVLTFPLRYAERTPPADVETEKALLGAVLMHPDVYGLVADRIAPHHFAEPLNGKLWQVIAAVSAEGTAPGFRHVVATLGPTYLAQPVAEGMTVRAYLAHIMSDAFSVASEVASYAQVIVQFWALRQIESEVLRATDGSPYVPGALLEDIYAKVDQLRTVTTTRKVHSISIGGAAAELVAAVQAELEGHARDVPSCGVGALDTELGGGLQPSSLIVGAARTSVGKSVLGIEVGCHVARQGTFAAIIHTLEMPARQVVARAIASNLFDDGVRLPYQQIMRRRGLTAESVRPVIGAAQGLRGMPLTIEDGGGRTIGDIAAASDRIASAYARRNIPLGLVVIDHAHIVRPSRDFNRQDEGLKEVADGALALAKHLDTCVLLLAQCNRNKEGADVTDRRPSLADIRGAGAFEENADAVLFLYRAAYYLERSPKFRAKDPVALDEYDQIKHDLELILDKNRAGRSNVVIHAWIDPALNVIRNRAHEVQP